MEPSGKVLFSRFTMEVVTAVAIICFGLVICYSSYGVGIGWDETGPLPGFFPFCIGALAAFSGIGSFVKAFVEFRGKGEEFLTTEQAKRLFAFFGPALAFVLASVFLGLYVGLALYLIFAMTIQGKFSVYSALAVGLGSAVIFYFVFDVWFQSPLLKGPLEGLLGIH